jgi:hypothetical protein
MAAVHAGLRAASGRFAKLLTATTTLKMIRITTLILRENGR